jgi:uncharacterized protein
MSVAARLFDLQVIDLELDGLKARVAAIETAMAENEAILAKRAATADIERKLASARAAQLDKELELKQHEEHLAATQTKLYGGSIRNPKELLDLQHDAERLPARTAASRAPPSSSWSWLTPPRPLHE